MIGLVDLAAQRARLAGAIEARIAGVLAHGRFILGPEVGELEERLAAYTGAAHCITVANGTDALQVALMALGVGPGDEVIVPAFGYIAAAEVVALLGARPVYVDIEEGGYNIAPDLVERAITPRTRAIIAMSLFGVCADMVALSAIGARHGIPVIEDAAQSLGASRAGRRSGNLSTIACTSFFPTKPLGCYGDGGAVFTSEPRLAAVVRQIARHGQAERYQHVLLGVNSRLDTLQAAILLAKLPALETEVAARARVAARYNAALAPFGLATQPLPEDAGSAHAQYTLRLPGADPQRDHVRRAMAAAGVATAVHYPLPLHHQPAVAASGCSFPRAEEAARRVLSLPLHADLGGDAQETVVAALLAATGAFRAPGASAA